MTPCSREFSVRQARLSDLPSLMEIEAQCFPEETAFPQGMFVFLIRNARTLVAFKHTGEVAGFIIGYPSGRTGIIYTLDVAPIFRRRGLATLLLSSLEVELGRCGARRFRLEAARDDPVARHLYRQAGYVEKEALRDYYGPGRWAVRMWKEALP
ncbi:MAG: putative N-acetyltransferase [Methanosaeta sp. PtaB.Bin039]|nr:MAG: putative N-acetyltransferase [Methanosaeta sp. PtaB.Bin039]HOT06591.1 N-acetyltransferase [Methanotrichaceae archaeon]HQF16527.1 N-acetyltransferase [Methanotrichaceae archaeon]HQI91102.1 N-acetyltransferase [Methanotrichaceae archaeon]HQJ28507.1 N-acetyltransferase [Methanotrichaceae archaeon]